KVTLYLPDDLHRQLKVRSALEREPMSALAQKALNFYLAHSEVVESFRTYGQTYRVYSCPECEAALTLQSEGLSAVKSHACLHEAAVARDEVPDRVPDVVPDVLPVSVKADAESGDASPDESELVPC
ncbi:MAG: hypothetical protein AAFQ61_08095, partial [Cyanobacteria bacterium J06626_23]